MKLLVTELVSEVSSDEGNDEAPLDALDELHEDSDQLSAEALLSRAVKMQETTTAAMEYLTLDAALASTLATGTGRSGNPVLEAALTSLAEASVTAIVNSLQEQEEQLKIYNNLINIFD